MDVRVIVDGGRAAWMEDNLQRLVVTDSAAVDGDSARLTLTTGPERLSEIRAGAEIRFVVNGERLGSALRVGPMSWNDRTGTIEIRGEPMDYDGALREPRDADWTGQTLGTIAGRIADRGGLAAAVDGALASVQPGEAIQTGESDLAFLRRASTAAVGQVLVKDGHLVVIGARSLRRRNRDATIVGELTTKGLDVDDISPLRPGAVAVVAARCAGVAA